jgi:hypothetical protein
MIGGWTPERELETVRTAHAAAAMSVVLDANQCRLACASRSIPVFTGRRFVLAVWPVAVLSRPPVHSQDLPLVRHDVSYADG